MYKYVEDVPLNQEEILKRIGQEEIFKLIFDEVIENRYITSPLRRDDIEPGAWFNWWNDKLYFYDFADPVRNVRDCFGVLMDHWGMSYREAMVYINQHFNLGLGTEKAVAPIYQINTSVQVKEESKTDIIFKSSKTFSKYHRTYFKSYGISRANLVEDQIFPVDWFRFWSSKRKEWIRITPDNREACYTINYWEDAKKIVRARYKGKGRFITNCNANHIGGDNDFAGDLLIITKSWKDYRVLKNAGLSAVWLQNEGQIPEKAKLFALISTYKRVLIWFDNDETGFKAAAKLANIINAQIPGKAHTYHLPIRFLTDHKVKDPSDLRHFNSQIFKEKIDKLRLTHENISISNIA